MIKPAGLSSRCDRYTFRITGEFPLCQCPNQATRRVTVEQLGEVYTWKRCQQCYDLLLQEIKAGRPTEILDDEILKQERLVNSGSIL